MKTREQIYSKEALGILRVVSMYGSLTEAQLLGLYPGKQKQLPNLLAYLVRQKRILQDENGLYTASPEPESYDCGMAAALWVLIDFIDQVDYHSSSEFPAKIIFFAQDEVYEIVYVASGQEVLISHVLSTQVKDPPNYIILVDKPEQIAAIQAPNIRGFCTVSPDGQVQYYQKQ